MSFYSEVDSTPPANSSRYDDTADGDIYQTTIVQGNRLQDEIYQSTIVQSNESQDEIYQTTIVPAKPSRDEIYKKSANASREEIYRKSILKGNAFFQQLVN